MRQIVFSVDKHLRVCSWGKQISAFTGRTPANSLGKKYYEVLPRIFVHDRDALALTAKHNKALSLKGYRLNCLYGETLADITIRPRQTDVGASGRINVVIRPFSCCSTANRLNQSQKLIDIGMIASTLAHGVRNPLNAIKGAVVYLREKYTREQPLAEFTKIMEEEISRLEHFISRFLSSSVSTSELKITQINTLLKKLEVLTSLQIYTRGIQSNYDLGDVPPVAVNSFHLEQALLNVINNAIEAMGEGGRLMVRSFTEHREGAPCAVIEITDTGPGMSDAYLDGAMQMGRNGGKGFGLFITREIMKCYKGHLDIESGRKEGTSVRLVLPAV